ncbi:regulatory protein RecX [Mitsuaria sp. WAJ17]|uniref:regulatory protein RecX n=1 Tax=Mitsuaria sp. WAJ17 TaxID=2761452 RepID=UPI00160458B6|nr:regulatory protein RecX [Mitsuaria sp. WAJ17]MBB2486758.1 regulatory protein RecX [Mitsuaria sp. WAJ17]
MASRLSALSLKARAIALLAQREHSVAELRRKLLRLAQQRDLQAWDAAQGSAAGAQPQRRPDAQAGTPQDARAVGSFDLDEDWGEGELDAFMETWDAEPALPGEDAPNRAAPGAIDPVILGDLADLAAPAHAGALDAGVVDAAGPQDDAAARSPRRRLDACAGGPHAQDRDASRRSRRVAPPSPEAWAAVMDETGQRARAEEVEQLLQWLQERSYLSETRLVESRINARAARYGNLRIQQELRQLGVAPDEEQRARLKDSEFERAREVWLRKFGGEAPVDAASRARQMRFLAARGFSSEVVRRVLRGDDD